jgi:hypothetical protein
MGRAALEIIGQGALGHSFDPLDDISSDHHKADAFKEFM